MKISCFLGEKKAFTLLELIVVVIIIGILAMVALPRFIRVAEKARSAEGRVLLAALRTAQFRYYAEHENYTNATGDLDATFSCTRYFSNLTAMNGSTGNYLGQISRTTIPGSTGMCFLISTAYAAFGPPFCYNLSINVTGQITCSDVEFTGPYKCADAGF